MRLSDGAKSFPEYVKWAREHRAAANFGPPAAGNPLHFLGQMVGRQVSAGVNSLTDMLEMHRSGRIRLLAIPGAKRSPLVPEVPTFAELGYPQVIVRGFFGVYAPAGTPAADIAAWNEALQRVLAQPDLRDRLAALAFDARGSTPAELDEMARRDATVWGPVIKASGFTVD